MDKYNNFLEILNRLTTAVSKMETAKTRQEVEALEKESKDYFKALTIKFPYIQADIHKFALKHAARTLHEDAQVTIGE